MQPAGTMTNSDKLVVFVFFNRIFDHMFLKCQPYLVLLEQYLIAKLIFKSIYLRYFINTSYCECFILFICEHTLT